MHVSSCNLSFPILYSVPSYGEAMRHQCDFVPHLSKEFEKYLQTGVISAKCDWGNFNLFEYAKTHGGRRQISKYLPNILRLTEGPAMILSEYIDRSNDSNSKARPAKFMVKMTVEGMIRRPSLTLLDSKEIFFTEHCDQQALKDLSVSWSTKDAFYPEYLVTLRMYQLDAHGNNDILILMRYLHVAPPPRLHLDYRIDEIVWIPKIFDKNPIGIDNLLGSIRKNYQQSELQSTHRKRRGFGLEIETVQMPPDYKQEYFTHLQQLQGMIKKAKNIYVDQHPMGDSSSRLRNAFDRLLLWDVSHDPQVENGAPVSRIDLYKRIQDSIDSKGIHIDTDTQKCISDLILGGRVNIPAELSKDLPNQLPSSQSSPEYKSPPPPNELYHMFPPPECGYDDADMEIALLLDGILKNSDISKSAIVVPTVSDIGQSASSIHVHVNVINKDAWPRMQINETDDVQETRQLLGVVFGWIIFDRVVQSFSKPWMWRDRSLGPMFANGPEFLWRELTWNHGTTALEPSTEGDIEIKMYNVPAFYRHIYDCFKSYDGNESLFKKVFSRDVIYNTIFRNNSLNLLALDKYGTVEFRRMHATLDTSFISAYTWFCVGFVEKFSRYSHQFVNPFIDDATTWEGGLENLISMQNKATIEDLMDFMTDPLDPVVTESTFQTLLGGKQPNS
jgi:hypothetical protein